MGVAVPAHRTGGERGREHEGAAELAVHDVLRVGTPLLRLADQQQAGAGDAVFDAFDLGGLQVVLGAERENGVDAGMAEAAGRVGLHRRRHQLPALAELLERTLRGGRGGVGTHEAVLALERLGRALEALAGQRGGGEAAEGGPADLEALGPGAVGEELQRARGLGERDAERVLDLARIEAHGTARGGGGPEGAAGGGGVEAAVVMRAGGQREGGAADHLVAGDDGGEHVCAGGADHLAGGEGRGDHRGAGMQAAGGVGVVEIERVAEGGVEEGSAHRRVARGVAEHARVARGDAERAGGGEHRRRALRVVAGADDVADEIEHQEAGARGDVRGDGRQRDAGGESGEGPGDLHRECLGVSWWDGLGRLARVEYRASAGRQQAPVSGGVPGDGRRLGPRGKSGAC